MHGSNTRSVQYVVTLLLTWTLIFQLFGGEGVGEKAPENKFLLLRNRHLAQNFMPWDCPGESGPAKVRPSYW